MIRDMLIAHLPDLADGEIELVTELPPSGASASRAAARVQRLQNDSTTLDALLADRAVDLRNEWIAVFDGEVFQASAFHDLLRQFDAHGVEAGRAVKHYVGGSGVARV